MARPRSFDVDLSLQQAMSVFWRQGYEATSVDDLVQATGVNRHSLYGTWGDKHGLYLATLDHYCRSVGLAWLALLDEGDPIDGIRRLFHTLADAVVADPDRHGCFALNTALELGARDPQAAQLVRATLDQVEQAFVATLTRALHSGRLAPGTDVAHHARHLAVSMQGVLLQARCAAPEATLRSFVQVALSTLPEVPPCERP